MEGESLIRKRVFGRTLGRTVLAIPLSRGRGSRFTVSFHGGDHLGLARSVNATHPAGASGAHDHFADHTRTIIAWASGAPPRPVADRPCDSSREAARPWSVSDAKTVVISRNEFAANGWQLRLGPYAIVVMEGCGSAGIG